MTDQYRPGAAWHTSIQSDELQSHYLVLPVSGRIVLIWTADGIACATTEQFCAVLDAVRHLHPSRHQFMSDLLEGIIEWDKQARWYAIDWLISEKLIRVFSSVDEALAVGTSMTEPPVHKPKNRHPVKRRKKPEQEGQAA